MSGNNQDADEEVFRGIAESNGGQEVTYFKDFPELDLKECLLKLHNQCSRYTSIINNDDTWEERLKVSAVLPSRLLTLLSANTPHSPCTRKQNG